MEQVARNGALTGMVKLVESFLVDSWRFITRPFSAAAWEEEVRNLRSHTPQSFAKSLVAAIPKLSLYYLLLSPVVFMPFYNSMIFHPFVTGDFGLKQIDGVPCENVFFPSANGKQLHAWFFKNPQATKTILVSHGNAGNLTNRDFLAQILMQAGASVLLYDYQGYGKSKGSPSIDGICQDGEGAYKYLTEKRGVKPSDIIVFGESVGTGAACDIAAHNPCAGIILQSPYTSLPAIGREKLPYLRLYPDWLFPANKLDNLSMLKKPHAPLLLIHGEKDTLIPIAHSNKIYAEAVGPKTIVRLPDASHNDIGFIDTYQHLQALTAFISSLP